MKKSIISIMLLSLFLLTGCVSYTQALKKEIDEEAIPIREKDKIIGLNYYVTIPYHYSYETVLRTHIIDSIFHYKSMDDIGTFYISVVVKNESNRDIHLKEVLLKNDSIVLQRFSTDVLFYQQQVNTFSITISEALSEKSFIEFVFYE